VVSDLQQWLTEAGLELHTVHAPASERLGVAAGGPRGELPSLASASGDARAIAVAETARALQIARRIPINSCVIHLGWPRGAGRRGGSNRDAARRSVEELYAMAEPLGVRLAIEVIQNDLSRASSLAQLVEEELETPHVGICLDVGHAHLDGDLVDAIEVAAGHLAAVHVHDNLGRADGHLVPFDGAIDWPAALTTLQKVGYDGALMFELSDRGPARDTLARARQARGRMDKLMAVR
jgi:sugar phosphate isomerase/epimerase